LSQVGYYFTWGYARKVEFSSPYVYMADGDSGLSILDVSNPSSPSKVGGYDTPGYAYSVALSGSLAYVADGDSGLRIINVSDPSSPVEIGHCDTPGEAVDVAIWDSYAYVADGDSGVRVIDVSDPSSPVEVGFYRMYGYANAVSVLENYIFVANTLSGLQVYEHLLQGVKKQKEERNVEVSVLSGIFNHRILLKFNDKKSNRIRVSLYNLYGAKVYDREYSSEPLLVIEGKEIEKLMPGVYFLVVDAGTGRETFKVVRLR
ncbi:hypothetical protein DRQ16_02605, partial [bacterium]